MILYINTTFGNKSMTEDCDHLKKWIRQKHFHKSTSLRAQRYV